MTGRGASGAAVAAAAGLAAAGAVLWATAGHGPGLSPDAIEYIAGARHLAAGRGLTGVTGAPIVKWPPLFPALLAAGAAAGLDPAAGARWLNALCHGGAVGAAAWWLWTRLKSRAVALLAALALLFAQPLLAVATFAWSEALLTVLAVLWLFPAERYLRDGEARARLALGLLAGLALLTRVPGAALAAAGAGLCLARPAPWAARVRDGAVVLALAGAPAALWLLRNARVAHTLLGDRPPSTVGLAENLGTVGGLLAGYVLPPGPLADPVRGLATAGAALVAGLTAWALWRHGRRVGWRVPPEVLPCAGFAFLYLALIVWARTAVGGSGGVEPRYVVPALVPLGLAAAWTVDLALAASRARGARPRVFGAALFGALAVWLLAYPVPYAGSFLLHQVRHGAGGYASDGWDAVMVVRALGARALPGAVRTNRPDLYYWFAGAEAAASPAAADLANPERRAALARDLEAEVAAGPVFLLWFATSTPPDLAPPEALAAALDLGPVAALPDGSATVHRLRSGRVRPPGPG